MPNPNPDPINTNHNSNPNNASHNHTLRVENSLELIQLSTPGAAEGTEKWDQTHTHGEHGSASL